jgi:hypothetical protein
LAISYSDLFAINHAREEHEDINVGDLVRTSPNLFPHWRVIAIDGDKAWLRDVQTQSDGVTELIRCRKVPAA